MRLVRHFLRYLGPKTLFSRAMLIMVLPMVLLQLISAYIFYDRHWASVTRQLSSSLAGEVTWLVEHWEHSADDRNRHWLALQAKSNYGLKVSTLPPMRQALNEKSEKVEFPVFEQLLRRKINRPFAIRYDTETEKLSILVPIRGAMMRIQAPKKRLASSTTLIFIGWMVGSSLLLIVIATLFLRNQIRPIIQLSNAAERFGRGQEVEGFRPSGAREVRQASQAFMEMRDRISRQVESRTAMLAGISHDLRTPLTRMRLELEMMQGVEGIEELKRDVDDMQRMVDSYLTFASGQDNEVAQKISFEEWLRKAVEPYQRRDVDKIKLGNVPLRSIQIRAEAMTRVIRNLIDNAQRYGQKCWISAKFRRNQCIIMVDDDGPGIPEDQRHEVFRAFKRLEDSRNSETGGAGLGLSIVRDVVHAHGGEVVLEDSPHGGLRVIISLPI